MDSLDKLYNDVLLICTKYVTSVWSNGWMWKNKGEGYGVDELVYHFLIYYGYGEFSYTDTNDLRIHIEGDSSGYRIDIRDRYNTHNFWYFSEENLRYVSMYVLKIIRSQYDSIVSIRSLLDMSIDAYDKEEPLIVYESMVKELRGKKLKRIIDG